MKFLCALIIFSFSFLFSIPVFAHSLTLNRATQMAIQNSNALRNLEDSPALSQVEEERIQTQLNIINAEGFTTHAFVENRANFMRLQAQRTAARENTRALREGMEYLALSHFANILTVQGELAVLDERINVLNKEIEIIELRLSLGLAGQNEYTVAGLNLSRQINERQNLYLALKTAHRELNRLIGTPLDRVHQIVFHMNYQEFNHTNITGHINTQIAGNPDVRLARALANASLFQLNNFFPPVNPHTGHFIPGGETRTEARLRFAMDARNIRETRHSLEDFMLDTYTSIRNLENAVSASQITLDNLLEQKRLLEERINLGQAAATELIGFDLEILILQEDIRRNQMEHKILVMLFLNPSIAG